MAARSGEELDTWCGVTKGLSFGVRVFLDLMLGFRCTVIMNHNILTSIQTVISYIINAYTYIYIYRPSC